MLIKAEYLPYFSIGNNVCVEITCGLAHRTFWNIISHFGDVRGRFWSLKRLLVIMKQVLVFLMLIYIIDVRIILTWVFNMPRTITFQPSQELGEFIENLVETGSYNNQSEVVRDGLRLLQEKVASSKLQQLKRLIEEGDNSPDVDGFSIENIKKRLNES